MTFGRGNTPNTTLIEEDGLFYAGECWYFYRDYNRALYCYRALVSTYDNSIHRATAMKRLYNIGCYWVEVSERNASPSINVADKDKPRFNSFMGAKKAFESIFMNDASDSGYGPLALFALAKAYMRRGVNQGDGAYASAAQYFKQLYEFYPGCKYAEDACMLAMISLHKSYQGPFYDDSPLNEARKLAETALRSGRCNVEVVNEELANIKEEQARHLFTVGQYYEKRGNFASARSYYNRLVKEYPNSEYATEGARAYEGIESKPAEADQLAWARKVAPFLPKSKTEYFEEAPDPKMSRIARRNEALDALGAEEVEPESAEVARGGDERRLR
ncbi:MAG: tetratricopeptide repeat protein [Thermoguttaceae bacterium]|nr:tetratricopeptide repeat protein [Thermoguttaceae bacterium]